MPPGEHAFHIHAMGECEPPSFDSACPARSLKRGARV
nr:MULTISPECIES: superoxide dismutase family protein [Bradyrhizobium]